MSTELNQYEAMFLFGASGADADKSIGIARGMVEKHGGAIQVIKKWDERKLAYEVKKQKRGTYVIVYFKAPSTTAKPLTREVELSEEVLRVLITRADHLNETEMNAVEPQPIAPPPERNPWDRDGGGYGGGGGGGGYGGGSGGAATAGAPPRAPRARREEPAGESFENKD